MFSAQEAREQTNFNRMVVDCSSFSKIKEKITEAINEGNYSVYVEADIFGESTEEQEANVKKLRSLGYEVEINLEINDLVYIDWRGI